MSRTKEKQVVLTADERRDLERKAASRTEEFRTVQRAQIVLLSERGDTDAAIAGQLNVNRLTVRNCVKKFHTLGVGGALEDLARSGRPASIGDSEKAWVRQLACQKPTEVGYAQELWTINLLTAHVQKRCEAAGFPSLVKASRSTVWKILNEADIKPHKIRYYLERRDPEFERKMREVLLVYKQVELEFASGPDSGVVVLSYDEKPGIQALSTTAPDLPPGNGHEAVGRDYEYVRHGTLSLLCALNLKNGEVIPLVRDSHKSSDFVDFLKILNAKYADASKIRLVLDNHSAHTSRETRAYLATVLGRFEFVFTPKHGSWLNLVESFFGKFTRVFLRGIRVSSKAEMAERIYRYMDEINAEPVVYHWKYRMEEIAI
jgi:transposase